MSEEFYTGLTATAGEDLEAQIYNKIMQNARTAWIRERFNGARMALSTEQLSYTQDDDDEDNLGTKIPMRSRSSGATSNTFDSGTFTDFGDATDIIVPSGFTRARIIGGYSRPEGNWTLSIVKNDSQPFDRFRNSSFTQGFQKYRFAQVDTGWIEVVEGDIFSLYLNDFTTGTPEDRAFLEKFVQGYDGTLITNQAIDGSATLIMEARP